MSGIFGFFGGAADKASKPAYSFETLQHLCTRLQSIVEEEQSNRENREEILVEVIRQITEALIWGEQNGHEPNFFDFFCEKNILADFVRILGLDRISKGVKLQLLQTLSMLIQNIRRDTSLYYLFSNNYVNQLIATQFDWGDEEILSYYISFLKSLALRLNAETITFFFNERLEQFPLYIEAIRFFGHRDQMVRTAIRNLTLQVYNVKDESMQRFVLKCSWRTYFVHLACHLRELWFKLDAARERCVAGGSENDRRALQEVNEQQNDLLMYISDVLSMEEVALREALAERVLQYAFFPVLLGSLGDGGAASGSLVRPAAGPRDRLSPECALFLLHETFDIFRSTPALLNPVVAALLLQRPPADLVGSCWRPPPPCPATYQATTPDVSAPCSADANSVAALDDGAPDEPGAPVYGRLAKVALRGGGEGAEGASDEAPRTQLLAQLRSSSDACVLLVAGILSACLACGGAWPRSFLSSSGLLPTAPPEGGGVDGGPEVVLLVVRALERHTSLRVVVLQALVQFVLSMAARAGPSTDGGGSAGEAAWLEAARGSARGALRSAAKHVRSYLQGALADAFLDIFAEEWEAHCTRPPGIKEACANLRCLSPQAANGSLGGAQGWTADWAFPGSSERQHAAKAIRVFLLLRQLCHELSKEGAAESKVDVAMTSSSGSAGGATSSSAARNPLHVLEEVADGYEDQRSVELGRQDRIVCAVASAEGRQSRYLVLHQFLLLLVQPDLVSPGWGIVRTLAPVRAVETQIDRNHPQTLRLHLATPSPPIPTPNKRLGIRLPKDAPSPGAASSYDPATCEEPFFRKLADEHRGSSFYMLTLNFMDTKRCHCADLHLRKRRQEVRAQLKKRAEEFVEGFCS